MAYLKKFNPIKSSFKTSFIWIFILLVYNGYGQKHLKAPYNTMSVTINGTIQEGEYNPAQQVFIQRTNDISIPVLVSYDSDFLYIAFDNLYLENKTSLYPEVLLALNTQITNTWTDSCFWFHASYGLCDARGEYYNWDNCDSKSSEWKANTFPLNSEKKAVEFKISWAKLGLKQASNNEIRIAFKTSDTNNLNSYWPATAKIEHPDSWGTLNFIQQIKKRTP